MKRSVSFKASRPLRRRKAPPIFRARRKIQSVAAVARIVRQLHRQGQTVVFTNGCFDLLHAGHVKLLERARGCGDRLIVGLNSDRSVRGLKGPARPITKEKDRALLLAALESVDHVVLFDAPTPLGLIERLRPDVLIKGADWGASAIVGGRLVRQSGGRVIRLPLAKGYSTSRLIERIVRRAG